MTTVSFGIIEEIQQVRDAYIRGEHIRYLRLKAEEQLELPFEEQEVGG